MKSGFLAPAISDRIFSLSTYRDIRARVRSSSAIFSTILAAPTSPMCAMSRNSLSVEPNLSGAKKLNEARRASGVLRLHILYPSQSWEKSMAHEMAKRREFLCRVKWPERLDGFLSRAQYKGRLIFPDYHFC
mgnify:FL=1